MKFRRTLLVPKWFSLWLTLGSIAAPALLAQTTVTPTEETVNVERWTGLKSQWSTHYLEQPPGSDVISDSAVGLALTFTNFANDTVHRHVLTMELPPITADRYAVRGRIRYENMGTNGGYLEMWSVFPPTTLGGPERRFFSRTLGEFVDDPMAKFVGASYWRPVALPFDATGAGARPVRLEIDAVIPAHGTIWLGPLETVQFIPALSKAPGANPSVVASSARRAAIGSSLTLIVLLVFLHWLAIHRQGRGFVLPAVWSVTALSWTTWIVTVYALDRAPETWVTQWRAFSLLAAVTAGAFTASAFYFVSRYRQAEWQRMAAIDASV